METRSLKQTVQKLKALADPTRIRLLAMLSQRSLCVCELTFALGLAQPTVSKHMKQLEDAGFVSRERDGTWIIYSIDAQDELSKMLLEPVMESVLSDNECRTLIKKLEGIDRSCISGDGRCIKKHITPRYGREAHGA